VNCIINKLNSKTQLSNVPYHQCSISSMFHIINVPYHQCSISSPIFYSMISSSHLSWTVHLLCQSLAKVTTTHFLKSTPCIRVDNQLIIIIDNAVPLDRGKIQYRLVYAPTKYTTKLCRISFQFTLRVCGRAVYFCVKFWIILLIVVLAERNGWVDVTWEENKNTHCHICCWGKSN